MRALRATAALACGVAVALAASPTQAADGHEANVSITIAHAAPDSLDPSLSATRAGFDIINQMFAGLTRSDARTGLLTLELAQSYTASSDLRTWTFTLNRGLRWSDGVRLTSGDVVFGIQRGMTVGTPAFRPALTDLIASVTALDQRTVQFRLLKPAAYLPAFLSKPITRPVPRHVIERFGAAWTDPANIAVSGAYRLSSESPAQIVLTKSGLPTVSGGELEEDEDVGNIDQVVYDIGDPSQFAAGFRSGTIDFVDTSLIGGLKVVAADPTLAPHLVVTGPADITELLLFNNANGATTNAFVRRALSSATDRASLSTAAFGDADFATTTLVPPRVFGSVPASSGVGISYNPSAALANRASAGAGFPNSIEVRFNCGNQRRAHVAALIKSSWESLFGHGFTVNVFCVAFSDLVAQISNPDPSVQAPVTLVGLASDYPDANDFLVDAKPITLRWSDAGYISAVSAAAATLDAAARRADYRRAEQILNGDVAAIAPLFNLPDAFVRQPQLTVVGDRVETWSVTTDRSD